MAKDGKNKVTITVSLMGRNGSRVTVEGGDVAAALADAAQAAGVTEELTALCWVMNGQDQVDLASVELQDDDVLTGSKAARNGADLVDTWAGQPHPLALAA